MNDGADKSADETMTLTRRRFLGLGAFAVAAVTAAAAFPAAASGRKPASAERALRLYNIHTGEQLQTVYWAQGRYIADALSDINHLLRDYRTGEVKVIDPGLLDLLHRVNRALRGSQPFHVVSGYRSPATNAMLAATTNGVAKHSLHMEGMAIDVSLPGRTLRELHRAALAMAGGGVGYYPRSAFVHLDVGPVRAWQGPSSA